MSYTIMYGTAWAVAAIGILSGVLAGSIVTPVHPSWLTPDIAGTAALVAAGCTGLETILPRVTVTPAARDHAYLAALNGILPPDIRKRFPTVGIGTTPTVVEDVPPE